MNLHNDIIVLGNVSFFFMRTFTQSLKVLHNKYKYIYMIKGRYILEFSK